MIQADMSMYKKSRVELQSLRKYNTR